MRYPSLIQLGGLQAALSEELTEGILPTRGPAVLTKHVQQDFPVLGGCKPGRGTLKDLTQLRQAE